MEGSNETERRRKCITDPVRNGCEGMAEEKRNSVYVNMMADVLRRKERILKSLYDLTKEQETLLRDAELDYERFQQILEEKGVQIEELNDIDEGFDALFKKVEQEIMAYREAYRDKIREMQQRITVVSELGIQIQALESQNSERLKVYLAGQKKQIREFHMKNKTASNYFQNMANTHKADQTYYFDETK